MRRGTSPVQGFPLRGAAYHAGRWRLRSILMTAIFGMLPLAHWGQLGATDPAAPGYRGHRRRIGLDDSFASGNAAALPAATRARSVIGPTGLVSFRRQVERRRLGARVIPGERICDGVHRSHPKG
jgi:hypothetical protein